MGKHTRRQVNRSKSTLRVPRSAPAPKRIGRRDFVRTASGILAAATVSSACGGDAGPPDGGDQPAFIFTSDWSTALGTNAAAMRDTNQMRPWNSWPFGGDGGALGTIIPSTGLDFPTANAFQVNVNAGSGGMNLGRVTGLGVPAVGVSRYYRWYLRYMAQSTDDNVHPMQDANGAGTTNWMFLTRWAAGYGTGYRPDLTFNGERDWGLHDFTLNTTLPTATSYRYELQISRIGTSTFQAHIRIYSSPGGTLLYDDADFVGNTGILLSTNPVLTVNAWSEMDGLNCGSNGVVGSGAFVYSYQAGFAVSDEDWCGPYVAGESP